MSSKKDRRQQILNAAQRVFAAKGFNGANIKDLAKAARISPGLLYWYFKDKASIITSLVTERIEEGLGVLSEKVSFEAPPKEFLPQFGRFFINLYEQPMNAALFKIIITNAQSSPAAVRQVRTSVINRVLGILQSYFQKQIDAGRIRPCDTEIISRTFMGSIVAFLLLKLILQDKHAQEMSVQALVDGITDVVLYGILPKE